MIEPAPLFRLLLTLSMSILEAADPEALSAAARRELLADFAGLHDLDLQDYATLVRVASGVQLLDCTGCATTLGVPEKTLAQWRYQGKGPTYIKVGKYVRYRAEDVEAYLTANTIRPRVLSTGAPLEETTT